MRLEDFAWTREPLACAIEDGRVEIVTRPHTDLWQRTYYHFRNDTAPVLQMTTREKFFSFVVQTEFDSHHRFDQCGIVVYLDSENWLKASIEYEDERYAHLGSVVTNGGYSDWATTRVRADVRRMWVRASAAGRTISASNAPRTGADFAQMRVCHLAAATDAIRFGIYACSPEDSSFRAVFWQHGAAPLPVARPTTASPRTRTDKQRPRQQAGALRS